MARLRIVLSTFLILVLAASSAWSGNRWIEETVSTDLREVVRDDLRDRVYVADVGANEVLVIDTLSESVVERVPVPWQLRDLALSKDGEYLVAGTLFHFVKVDLETFESETIPHPQGFPLGLSRLTLHSSGLVVALGFDTIAFVVDLDAGAVVNSFGHGHGRGLFDSSQLKTDASGDTLWIVSGGGNRRVFKFDISDPLNPIKVGEESSTEPTFLRDFVISPTRDELYLSYGYPYGVQVYDALALADIGFLPGERGPAALDVDPAGEGVFFPTRPASPDPRVYHYSTDTHELLAEYPLEVREHNGAVRPQGLAIDRRGRKLFISHGTDPWIRHPELRIQVVDVGIPVEIDIRPGSKRNPVNVRSRGVLPVAVLSSEDFNAADVDFSSLRFGPGDARTAHNRGHFEDVNRDGLLDLVAHFRMKDTGLECGDDSAQLEGVTTAGTFFFGSDDLTTVGCR